MNIANDSFLTFGIGRDVYALPLTRVREIVSCRTVVRVPKAAASVRGVMNLRGSVVPVIDFARHLGLGDTPLSENTCALLLDNAIDGESSPLAGLVEQIHGVIDDGQVMPTPEFGTRTDPSLLLGITPQGEGFAYLIDIDAILNSLT